MKDKSVPSSGSAETALSLQINTRHLKVVRHWLLSVVLGRDMPEVGAGAR